MVKTIENRINDILAFGTKIVSFDYDGKRRNVLVGSKVGLDSPRWGHVVSRGVRRHGNRHYIVGLVNNEGQRNYKTFAVDKVLNPSF
jgi:hypothetical protein